MLRKRLVAFLAALTIVSAFGLALPGSVSAGYAQTYPCSQYADNFSWTLGSILSSDSRVAGPITGAIAWAIPIHIPGHALEVCTGGGTAEHSAVLLSIERGDGIGLIQVGYIHTGSGLSVVVYTASDHNAGVATNSFYTLSDGHNYAFEIVPTYIGGAGNYWHLEVKDETTGGIAFQYNTNQTWTGGSVAWWGFETSNPGGVKDSIGSGWRINMSHPQMQSNGSWKYIGDAHCHVEGDANHGNNIAPHGQCVPYNDMFYHDGFFVDNWS